MTLFDYLQFPFVQYALIVGTLTAFCASLIGVPIVLKRLSFIGDGLSHIAFLGMTVAIAVNMTNRLYIILPVTIITSIILLVYSDKFRLKGDAIIAIVSVSALAIGYFIMNTFTISANISGDICASLFGSTSILTLKLKDVYLCVAMSVAVIVLFLFFYNKIFALTFDPEYLRAVGVKTKKYEILIATVIAVVISLSMQLVGSLLTSALIIFPALSSMRVFKNFKAVVLCSGVVSVVCALGGMLTSIYYGTPVGSTIVIVNIILFSVFCISAIIKRRFSK
jgi:zinc transport system permease protein